MRRPKTGILAKLLIPAILAYALYMITDAGIKREEGERMLRQLSEQAQQLQQENERLRRDMDAGFVEEVIASIARERFGLVFPDEKVFYDPGAD